MFLACSLAHGKAPFLLTSFLIYMGTEIRRFKFKIARILIQRLNHYIRCSVVPLNKFSITSKRTNSIKTPNLSFTTPLISYYTKKLEKIKKKKIVNKGVPKIQSPTQSAASIYLSKIKARLW